MTFGDEGKMGARVHDAKDVDAILDVFVAHGHSEVIFIKVTGFIEPMISSSRSIVLAHIVEEPARRC